MGKATQRRKANRRNYLAELCCNNPERFKSIWKIRVGSWLSEIHNLIGKLKEGEQKQESAFTIVDEAMAILRQCENSICEKRAKKWIKELAQETYSVLLHECCAGVSSVFDRRLYRLSKMDQLIYKSKASRRESEKSN